MKFLKSAAGYFLNVLLRFFVVQPGNSEKKKKKKQLRYFKRITFKNIKSWEKLSISS